MAENIGGLPTGSFPDVSKANLYDQPAEQQQSLLDSLEQGQKSLEQRYANPNWFNVAAGFLKPQLGGFMASLGSANQALGENLEKQRANELTVAQQRAQVALMKNQIGQNTKAAALAKELSTKSGGITPEDVANVRNLSEARGAVVQAQLDNQNKQREQIMAAHAAGRSDAELAAQYGLSFATLFPEGTPKLAPVPGASKIESAPDVAAKVNTPPPELNMTQDQWDNTPLTRRNELTAELASSNKDVALKSMGAYRAAAENAQPKLQLYQGMRELASSKDMDKVFNLLGGNDAVSLAGKAISEGRLTDRLANIDELLRNANITDPDLRRRTAELVKLINENKSIAGNSTSSPTDQATALRAEANPSLNTPRTAFLALTDALAHTEANHRDLFDILNSKKPNGGQYNAANFITENAFKENKRKFMEEHANILKNPPRDVTPTWYMPAKTSEAPKAPAASASKHPRVTTQSLMDLANPKP
jgi:hypothetical protein